MVRTLRCPHKKDAKNTLGSLSGAPEICRIQNVIRRLQQGLLPTQGHEREAETTGELRRRPWEDARTSAVTLEQVHCGRGGNRKHGEAERNNATRRSRAKGSRRNGVRNHHGSHRDSNTGRQHGSAIAASSVTKRLREEAMQEIQRKRRRLTGKGPEPKHDVKAIESLMCTILLRRGWTNRVLTHSHAVAAQCAICDTPTRCICRGCERRVCFECARARRPCPAMVATK